MSTRSRLHAAALLVAVGLLAGFFAMVEIQIEGPAGWAANLPTWRVEKHWLLDVFWGGRAMTGYHAWVFPFIFLVFHLPCAFLFTWSPRLEARALACSMMFWIIEDLAWFLANPAFGWSALDPVHAAWHKHWLLGLPVDYWTFTLVGLLLYWWSFTTARPAGKTP